MSHNYSEYARIYTPVESAEQSLALQRIVRTAFGIADAGFREVRADISHIRPPILIVEANDLEAYTKPTFDKSPYTKREQGDIVYEAAGGVVYASRQRVEHLIRQGVKGEYTLTEIFLEEFTHAYTTMPGRTQSLQPIRVGMMRLKFPRQWHTLQPGCIYAYDLSRDTIPDPVDPVYPLDRSLHMTENLTRIVVQSLLYEHIVKHKLPQFRMLRMIPMENGLVDLKRMGSAAIMPKLWKTARSSLSTGSELPVQNVYPKHIFDLLYEKELFISLSTMELSKGEDLFDSQLL